MPTMLEKFSSRSRERGNKTTIEVVYTLANDDPADDDDGALHDYFDENLPPFYEYMELYRTTLKKDEGINLWTGTAYYGYEWVSAQNLQQEGDNFYEFETGGGSQKISQAVANIGNYALSGETAPQFQGAIGVTDDNVEGVDIIVPSYHFSETHLLNYATVTGSYKQTLRALTGKVNSDEFRDLDPGECLFLGASGRQRTPSGNWEVVFRFAASDNLTGISVGGITGIAKKGFEYLWVSYKTTTDAGPPQRLVKIPHSAHVEQVYRTAAFAGLGI
jgi:hypothetical protein